MTKQTLINPRKLFSNRILNFRVKTSQLGRINYVNLDNAATTPPFKAVELGIKKYLTSYGSVHRGAGTKSKISTNLYEKSREVIKKFVNAPDNSYVLFTKNTTEAMNVAAYFFSFLKGKVAVSAIEHSSSWLPWIKAEGIKACGEKQIEQNELDNLNEKIQFSGREQVLQYYVDERFEFDLDSLEKLLQNNRIKVVVLTASSNVTGYCPDIKKIGSLVHKHKALFVVDACQFIQHHKIDMQEMGIDFLAASGHKFYAPFGGGFLVGPKKFFDNFLPYQIGGGNLPYITEQGEFIRYKKQLAHDPGTPNGLGAISMALALKQLQKIGLENIEKYEKKLTKKFFNYLKINPKIEVLVRKKHLNTVVPFIIKEQDSTMVAERLNDEFGIGVRAGSFCVYQVIRKLLKIKDESEIITSVRLGQTNKIPSVIRASIGLCNTENDIDRLIFALKKLTK